ncbi:FAD:protein FMN transferase [Patescibacteria group bacterium]|jgi:thiamine biosynthesis lipoprotein|nr:FAD:protein FMN transferase [Patescibacteria group bacterium]
MRRTEIIMGMPITIEIVNNASRSFVADLFNFFRAVDCRFSPYKNDSELAKINQGLPQDKWSKEMKEVMRLSEQTKQITYGYFDINRSGKLDPSGIVKGWSIAQAAKRLKKHGLVDFYVEAGGDIQAEGHAAKGEGWLVGIRNPFKIDEIVKVLSISGQGVATSGAYIRGEHVYNPLNNYTSPKGVASITVIATDILDADRFATAAYAMGMKGINLIRQLPGLEAYQINSDGKAIYTPGFEAYVA